MTGSDSSGGAGIQGRHKNCYSIRFICDDCYYSCNSSKYHWCQINCPINPKEIYKQVTFSSNDIRPDAVKIGMLHSTKVIKSVIKSLDQIKVRNIVLDPVMVAKGGAKLIDNKAINLLKSTLIKKVLMITPNIPEAEILTNTKIKTKQDMIVVAQKLIQLGVKNVLIKGGHLKGEFVHDIYVNNKDVKIFNSKRIKQKILMELGVLYPVL